MCRSVPRFGAGEAVPLLRLVGRRCCLRSGLGRKWDGCSRNAGSMTQRISMCVFLIGPPLPRALRRARQSLAGDCCKQSFSVDLALLFDFQNGYFDQLKLSYKLVKKKPDLFLQASKIEKVILVLKKSKSLNYVVKSPNNPEKRRETTRPQ